MTLTAAIVVDDCDIPGQTFVHRHIGELCGGNTVIVTRSPPLQTPPKPFCVYDRRRLRLKTMLRHGVVATLTGRGFRNLETFLTDHSADVMLAEFGYSGLGVYREAARLGIPLFCYFRGADSSRRLTSARYVRSLRAMMPHLAGVFAVSKFLVGNLAARGIVHPSTHVIPSGVDTEAFAPGVKDADLLVSVGRFVPKKDHLLSLKAFHAVSAEWPALRFEIVGDGKEMEPCRRYAAEAGLAGRVIFHGYRDHDFVRGLLAASPIFLQHSVTDPRGETEGMPTAIQEAMASGNVVISTRHAGIPEHVTDGVNGFLVPEGDLAAHVAALRTVLADRALQAHIAGAARDYAVARLDYGLGYARIEDIFARAVAPGSGREKCNFQPHR